MSAQPNGATATSAVAELSPRGALRRGRPDAAGRRDGEVPDPLVDQLADRLSILLADRLADRLLVRMAGVASRVQEEDDNVQRIPEGARYATSHQLAARYQVSVQWVESHAANLGATAISDSANSKLRYHLATADAYMDTRRRRPQARARGAGGRKPKPSKRTHTRTGRPLLDVE